MYTEKYTGHTFVGEIEDATDFIRFLATEKVRPVCILKENIVEWISTEDLTTIDIFFLGRASHTPPVLEYTKEYKELLNEPSNNHPYKPVTIDGITWWCGKPVKV
jgi:hypothetical protein